MTDVTTSYDVEQLEIAFREMCRLRRQLFPLPVPVLLILAIFSLMLEVTARDISRSLQREQQQNAETSRGSKREGQTNAAAAERIVTQSRGSRSKTKFKKEKLTLYTFEALGKQYLT